ncbi:hypothetical protein ACQ5SO_08980 [Rhodovulum sp. DZ06]|uniref:hypothetical protein n=1 Tax=Rhodovulum sp. DZ06 TaxID=3425126 RepID=UPI003D341684
MRAPDLNAPGPSAPDPNAPAAARDEDAPDPNAPRRARFCRFCFRVGATGMGAMMAAAFLFTAIAVLWPAGGAAPCTIPLWLPLQIDVACAVETPLLLISGLGLLLGLPVMVGMAFWSLPLCAEARDAQLKDQLRREAPMRAAAKAARAARRRKVDAQAEARRAARTARKAEAAAAEAEARAARKAARKAARDGG